MSDGDSSVNARSKGSATSDDEKHEAKRPSRNVQLHKHRRHALQKSQTRGRRSVVSDEDDRQLEIATALEGVAQALSSLSARVDAMEQEADVEQRIRGHVQQSETKAAEASYKRRIRSKKRPRHRHTAAHACCRPTSRTITEEERCDKHGRCETSHQVTTHEDCGVHDHHRHRHDEGRCGHRDWNGRFYGCSSNGLFPYGHSGCEYRRLIQPVCGPSGCVLAETDALTCNSRPWWAPGVLGGVNVGCAAPSVFSGLPTVTSCNTTCSTNVMTNCSPFGACSGPAELLNGNLIGYNERSLSEPQWLVT